MNKVLLIDGHSILNRAFYGLPNLTNSKGQHTNAVLGFINILLKLMDEEKPTHMFVAFDVHQPTFRHEMYKEYKGTRKGMPDELREQVPLLKEVLKAMGVTMVEKGGYEADDIIGTMSRIADSARFQVTIVSGDRDLLQLATDRILVRIPKTKPSGTVIENYYADDVKATYQVTPTEFIDLKGLMGDASDNIKGVPGIGEKTATQIITAFHSIENAYAHIDEIKPKKAKENLETYYDQAIFSKQLATIKLDCELEVTLEAGQLDNLFTDEAYALFKQLEFKQLMKHFQNVEVVEETVEYQVISDWSEAMDKLNQLKQEQELGLFIGANHEDVLTVSISLVSGQNYLFTRQGFLTSECLLDMVKELAKAGVTLAVMDLKSILHCLQADIAFTMQTFDAGVAAYLLNPLKDTYGYDDISRDYLGKLIASEKELMGKQELNDLVLQDEAVQKFLVYSAYAPLHAKETLLSKLREVNMESLYVDLELPCVFTLYHMEIAGVKVDKKALLDYGTMLGNEISVLEKRIYENCGETFNINSPKQLGVILFEKLGLPNGKKTKTGYSTSADVLDKLKNDYPVVQDILNYRTYAKLKSTYADGLANYISDDGRIYGTFNQTITATGRISSTEPNLQNIPMRMDIGRQIRKVFIPENGYIYVDADYSQIELRVMAHLSNDPVLIDAYQKGLDIHASTASEVFEVPLDEVTDLQRRHAKVVNFGIIYGQSAFGLSEELNISRKEASAYIEKYFETYQSVKAFLDSSVETAKKLGYSETMLHRRRPIPELTSSNFMQRSFGERIAMNSPIQGTAADIIKIAMVRVDRELVQRGLKSRLVLQIHDELLIEAAIDELEEVKDIVKTTMEEALMLSVPLEADMHVGTDWFEAK